MRSRDAAALVVEQVGGDDLEVVVGGVREGALAVAVAQRPDARARWCATASSTMMKPRSSRRRRRSRGRGRRCSGARPTASSRCEPRTSRRPLRAVDADHDAVAGAWRRAMHSAPVRTAIPSRSRMSRIAGRHIFVLARDQPRRHLDDGDLAAEAAVHLPELEADVAAADDDQVLGQEVDLHHGAVGRSTARSSSPGSRRHERPSADVDEDPVRRRGSSSPTRTFARRLEAGVALIDGARSAVPLSQASTPFASRPRSRPCAP